MHKVKRVPCSCEVLRYLSTWHQLLDEELNTKTSAAEKSATANEHWKKRNKSTRIRSLKKELLKTYKGCCCYCEGKVTDTGYGHIEHRVPKSKEPGRTFEEANLHFSCEICNITKGDKFNDGDEILDACHDHISDHIFFDDTLNLLATSLSPRGTTTIDDCNLNRDELLEARQTMYINAMNLFKNINESSPDTELNSRNRNSLIRMAEHGEAYCSVARLILNKNRNSFIDIDEAKWEK